MMSSTKTSTTKAAEIHRKDNGSVHYFCFHCGFDSDQISAILDHIEIHFASTVPHPDDDQLTSVNDTIKYEQLEELDEDYEMDDAKELQQVFIDCGTKTILEDESGAVVAPLTQDQMGVVDEETDLRGLFEWKCLHCKGLFKTSAKLAQHLLRHGKEDPVLHEMSEELSAKKARAHFILKCTLCSSEFYDSRSSEEHLKNFHSAPQPETFQSPESLQSHMPEECVNILEEKASLESNAVAKIEKIVPPAGAAADVLKSSVGVDKRSMFCHFCDKKSVGLFAFMQHTFSHFGLKIFSCTICLKEFQTLRPFTDHMKKEHQSTISPSFLCKFCDDVEHSNAFDFVLHAFHYHLDDGDHCKSHLDTSFTYQCRFCYKQFESWNDADDHRRTHHLDEELPKELPPATVGADARDYTERAWSGLYRSEILFSCRSCLCTMCGSYEARKHWISRHDTQDNPVYYRVLLPNEVTPLQQTLKCYDCDAEFDSDNFLMRHRLGHFNIKPYSCGECPQAFSIRSVLTRHMAKEHTAMVKRSRQLICSFCNAKFVEDSSFIAHTFKEHLYENTNLDENLDDLCRYECVYCSYIATEHETMTEHIHGEHEDEEIPSTSETDNNDPSMLINELRHKVEFTYNCIYCPKKFRLPFVARKHVKTGHRAEVRVASESQKILESQKQIEQRLQTHCHLCDNEFATWRSLVNHKAKCHPETMIQKPVKRNYNRKKTIETIEPLTKPTPTPLPERKKNRKSPEGNQCNVCNLTFLNNRSMINHRTKRHPETVDKSSLFMSSFTCKICGRVIRDRSNYHAHVQRHKTSQSYSCDLCGKVYRLKNSLQIHILTHSNEKNFVCEECGKSFYTTSKLNLHKQIHENLTLKCDKCDKVFYTRKNFSKHAKTHIDSERKKCPMCDNTFKSSASLRIHMLLHQNTKKYTCRYCDQMFSQSSGRRGHERTKHGIV